MTFARVQELRRERVTLHNESKPLIDKTDRSAEDNEKLDRMLDALDENKAEITRLERSIGIETEMGIKAPENRVVVDPETRKGDETLDDLVARMTLTPEVRKAYNGAVRAFMREGRGGIGADEKRALLQAGSDIGGGFLILAMEQAAGLLKKMDDDCFIRNYATKYSLPKAESLGRVSLDNDPDDYEWTTELKTGTEDTAMSFGLRELTPHPFAKRVKISEKLLRSAVMNVEQIALDRLRYKAAVTEEKAFLTGDGNKKPLGLMVASNDGIPTTRDVVCSATTTTISGDGFIDVQMSIKPQYQGNCIWGLSRELIKRARKLKSNDSQYLWQPGLNAGQPDLILGKPYFMSEFMPATFTAGLYVGFYGDLSKYEIVDALDLRIQRLAELYAEENKVGLILRKETDAMPVLSEAISRMKMQDS